MHFARLFTILLVFVFAVILFTLVLAFGEEFAEKMLPLFMGGTVIVYIFLSWYLGYFFATQKPPQELITVAVVVLVIVFLSGYFMGSR